MSTLAQRIDDALDDALKNEIAGAVTILYRKLMGQEKAADAEAEFRTAIEIAGKIDEEARRIVGQILEVK
jgi:hypothetical protein